MTKFTEHRIAGITLLGVLGALIFGAYQNCSPSGFEATHQMITDSSLGPAPAPLEEPPSDFSPPYLLPGRGQAVAISTNSISSITPTDLGLNAYYLEYSIFNSYGGGTFVADYSTAGAWVAAGTGGHAHPDFPGAVIFDFTDAKWKIRLPADANAKAVFGGYSVSMTTGDPLYEILNTSQVPVPAHPYANLAPLPKAFGGGSLGGVIYVTRQALCRESKGSNSSHRFDLATGQWVRVNVEPTGLHSSVESDTVFDAYRKRYYVFSNQEHYFGFLRYLDATDWQIKKSDSFPAPSSEMASGRVILYKNMLLRITGQSLWLLNPDDVSGGWKKLSLSGTMTHHPYNRYVEWRGRLYNLPSTGGRIIARLTPPEDPFNGTWVADSVSIDTELPAKFGSNSTHHYSNFTYVPAVDRLAWVVGAGVYLVAPE